MGQKNDYSMFDPTGLLKTMHNDHLEVWAKTMVQFVNTDAYADATGKMLDVWLSNSTPFRKMIENALNQTLANLGMPSRAEVALVAERLTGIEMRLDDMDAKLDELLQAAGPATSGKKAAREHLGEPTMTATTEIEERSSAYSDVYAKLAEVYEKWGAFNRLVSTDAKIAQTPKTLIWTLNKAKLYRYVPVVPEEKRHRVPLLLVFAIMNRPHVLDLRPGHSFAEYMVNRGYDIYLLDWGAQGLEDKNLKFDDYALEYLPRVVRKIKSVSGSQPINMLGWCLGALISTLYASLRPDDGLKNLILLTAPLDFSNKSVGGFVGWASSEHFNADRLVETFGNVPGEMIDYGAKTLKPVENFIGTYLNLWERIDDPKVVEAWHAMNTWVRDIIPMAGGAHRQLINEFYKQNRLKEGTLMLRGERVDLKNLTANVLNVIAETDHITPPCQSEGIMDLIGSRDKEILRVRGGHIGIMAGSGAEKSTWPHIEAWLAKRAD